MQANHNIGCLGGIDDTLDSFNWGANALTSINIPGLTSTSSGVDDTLDTFDCICNANSPNSANILGLTLHAYPKRDR